MRPIRIPSYISKHNRPNDVLLSNISTIKKKIHGLQKQTVPLVSVVIPAYNEEKGILKTLSSLSDTATDFPTEIIVVDNNSSDETKNLILQAGAIYLFEEKQGVKNARNCGLDYARGRYIINGDADTIYSPYWINSLIKPLVNDETIAVAYGKFAFIPEPGYTRLSFFFYETIGDIFKRVQGNLKDKAMYIYGCSSAYRKTQGIAVDRYEHPPGANEDGYLGLKLRNRFGKLQQIKQPKSLAWTSSRKFITDGSLLNRIIKKFRRSF